MSLLQVKQSLDSINPTRIMEIAPSPAVAVELMMGRVGKHF